MSTSDVTKYTEFFLGLKVKVKSFLCLSKHAIISHGKWRHSLTLRSLGIR